MTAPSTHEPTPASEDRPPEGAERRARRWAAVGGAVAAGAALGAGELVSGLSSTRQSLVGGVAREVVDRAGGDVSRTAIDVFGTSDKAALIVGTVAISLLVGAWTGIAARRRPWVGPVVFGGFALAGAWAASREPFASTGWAVAAAACAAAVGVATLRTLARVALTGHALPPPAPTRIERPSGTETSRRAFFGWAGAAGAFGVVTAVAGRALTNRSSVGASRAAVRLPPVTPGGAGGSTSTAPVPGGVANLDVDGISPYLTPNDDFYRIDTALLVPQVDPASWSLAVTGMVDRPYELGFDELLALPMQEHTVTLSCVSNKVGDDLVGNARWQGVPLRDVLDRAGVQPGGTQVVGTSVDGFTVGFPTTAVYDGLVAMVAVGMNGEPLPIRHGFPARLVVAGLYGYVSATKWLREIRLTGWDDFDAYWVPRGWAKEAPIKTQSRIDVPRAGAIIDAGPTAIAGVAWAPTRGISKVEVQIGDGEWREARLGEVLSDDTWRQWALDWVAEPGDHTLHVRATDGTGTLQTAEVRPPAPDGATGWHTRSIRVRA